MLPLTQTSIWQYVLGASYISGDFCRQRGRKAERTRVTVGETLTKAPAAAPLWSKYRPPSAAAQAAAVLESSPLLLVLAMTLSKLLQFHLRVNGMR